MRIFDRQRDGSWKPNAVLPDAPGSSPIALVVIPHLTPKPMTLPEQLLSNAVADATRLVSAWEFSRPSSAICPDYLVIAEEDDSLDLAELEVLLLRPDTFLLADVPGVLGWAVPLIPPGDVICGERRFRYHGKPEDERLALLLRRKLVAKFANWGTTLRMRAGLPFTDCDAYTEYFHRAVISYALDAETADHLAAEYRLCAEEREISEGGAFCDWAALGDCECPEVSFLAEVNQIASDLMALLDGYLGIDYKEAIAGDHHPEAWHAIFEEAGLDIAWESYLDGGVPMEVLIPDAENVLRAYY